MGRIRWEKYGCSLATTTSFIMLLLDGRELLLIISILIFIRYSLGWLIFDEPRIPRAALLPQNTSRHVSSFLSWSLNGPHAGLRPPMPILFSPRLSELFIARYCCHADFHDNTQWAHVNTHEFTYFRFLILLGRRASCARDIENVIPGDDIFIYSFSMIYLFSQNFPQMRRFHFALPCLSFKAQGVAYTAYLSPPLFSTFTLLLISLIRVDVFQPVPQNDSYLRTLYW